MGGKSVPVPDYTGAAEAQGASSRQSVLDQLYANRPNVTTPWGSMTWTRPNYPNYPGPGGSQPPAGGGAPPIPTPAGTGGGYDPTQYNPSTGTGINSIMADQNAPNFGGATMPSNFWGTDTGGQGGQAAPGGYDPSQWAMNVQLSPELQAAAQSQMNVQAGRSALTEGMLPQASADLARGVDWGGMPGVTGGEDARNRAEEALYSRYASRLDPQWQQRQGQMETKLLNQGLVPGTEAYTNSMRDLNQAQNDAYQTAMREAVTGGGAEASRQYGLESANRARAIQEAYQQQYGGLNALNAAMGGQQVQMPQFPGFSQAGAAQPTQYMQAAQLGYMGNLQNQSMQNAGLNSLFGGLGSFLPFMI